MTGTSPSPPSLPSSLKHLFKMKTFQKEGEEEEGWRAQLNFKRQERRRFLLLFKKNYLRYGGNGTGKEWLMGTFL